MNIDFIDDFEQFKALRSNFDYVYSADPNARFFISWTWLLRILGQCEKNHEPWFILAARLNPDASSYVAFFPLKVELHEFNPDVFYNLLTLLGVTDADHIPFICLPDYETAAISAFAVYLQQREEWSILRLENVQPSSERLRYFLKQFSNSGVDISEQRHVSDLDAIDNNVVPFVALPMDWDEYLQTQVSSNSRQRIKRFLRKVDESHEYRITEVDGNHLDQHLELLCKFWESSWESRKGADVCRQILDFASVSLRHCFDYDCLYLPVLWRGDEPLGAIANILDKAKKTVLFYIGGRNETIKDIPSGLVLHAYSIRYAIQHGFKLYDFLMGNEAYKYSFGAQERHIRTVIIQRQKTVNLGRKLDAKTIPQALHIASMYHRAHRLAEAKSRYHQILTTQPDHLEARYGLGVVLQRQDDSLAAERVFKALLDDQPGHAKAWFGLGTLYQTQGQLDAAETAYRQVLATHPESMATTLATYHNLGYTLQQQNRWEEAIACYEMARTLEPDNPEADAIWANAMHTLGKLSPQECAHYAAINQDLGNRRRHAGDLNVAVEYYRQAIALQPDRAETHYHLGLAFQALTHWDDALACYQTALTLQPDHRAAEANAARVSHALGRLTPDQQSHYANVCIELGTEAKQANDLEAALRLYRQAIALKANLATAHYHLGLTLHELNHWEEAIAHFQTVLDLHPADCDVDLLLADALHALGRLTPEQRIHYASRHCDVGNRCKQTGDLKQAIEQYQLALTMNPDLESIRETLRLALQEQNDVQIKVSHAKH